MVYYGKELYHHGVQGMKWGVRRIALFGIIIIPIIYVIMERKVKNGE